MGWHLSRTHFLGRLVDLGLSERQAKVYLALLTQKNTTIADLQRSSGVPQTKVYEIVRQLVEMGYCRKRKVGTKRYFEALNPEAVLIPIIKKLEMHLEDTYKLKEELLAVYNSSADRSEPAEFVEILHGKESIHHHYLQLLNNSKSEILGFGRPPYTCDTAEKIEEQGGAIEQFIARGGVSRWVYQLNGENEEWLLPGLERLVAGGVQVRIADHLPLKMMIFDAKEVLVAQEDPFVLGRDLTMTIMKQGAIADAYRALFDFVWNQATNLQSLIQKEHSSQ